MQTSTNEEPINKETTKHPSKNMVHKSEDQLLKTILKNHQLMLKQIDQAFADADFYLLNINPKNNTY